MSRGSGVLLSRGLAAASCAAIAAVCGPGACARDPVEGVCQDIAPGELVITEIRGPQGDDDLLGEWIEVFNASGRSLDLQGLRLDLRSLTGAADGSAIVRLPDVVVEPGAYAVFGRFEAGGEPPHVDYGYLGDFDRDLRAGAIVDLVWCGVAVDRVVYGRTTATQLPNPGTLALDGAAAPDAARNDDDAAWCVDAREDPANPTGPRPGTPGQTNPACTQEAAR